MVLSNDLVLCWRVHYHRAGATVPYSWDRKCQGSVTSSQTLFDPAVTLHFFPKCFPLSSSTENEGRKKKMMKCVDMVYMIHAVLQRAG